MCPKRTAECNKATMRWQLGANGKRTPEIHRISKPNGGSFVEVSKPKNKFLGCFTDFTSARLFPCWANYSGEARAITAGLYRQIRKLWPGIRYFLAQQLNRKKQSSFFGLRHGSQRGKATADDWQKKASQRMIRWEADDCGLQYSKCGHPLRMPWLCITSSRRLRY